MRILYAFTAAAVFAFVLAGWTAPGLPPARVRADGSQNAYTPDGLRFRDGWELRWGQSRREIALHLGAAADCRDIARNSMGLAHCGVGRGVLPPPFIAGDAWFMNGRFFRAFLVFNPDDYNRVARLVSTGFGGPGATLTGSIRLYTGARAPQVETNWGAGDVTAVMRLHDGDDGQGSLSIIYDPIANEPPGETAHGGY